MKLITATAGLVTLAVLLVLGALVWAQSPSTQSPAVPQWQTDAGGTMAFNVASVKQNKSGPPPSGDKPNSNFPLGPGDVYSPNGGLFTATNMPLLTYISFAYKMTSNQLPALQSQLPKWATTDRFDIQARVDCNPTKDQMRLMMQSLLADRFKLALHWETRLLPVFALVLSKPGKTGPQLQQHPNDSSCSTASPPPSAPSSVPPPATVADRFPITCGGIVGMPPSAPGRLRGGGRNVSMELIAKSLTGGANGVDRPILDQTGLTGTFDFSIEYTPEPNGPPPPSATFQADQSGPTFLEALKEQLGLKLESQTGPVDVLVIDHIEEPFPN